MLARTLSRLLPILLLACSGCLDLFESCSGGSGGGGGSGSPAPSVRYQPFEQRAWAGASFSTGNPVASVAVAGYVLSPTSPPLPAGLTLDPVAGAISGVPEASQAAVEYSVHVQRDNQSPLVARVEIVIHDAIAPSALSYAPNPIVAELGSAILDSVPTLTGVAESFSVAPALPVGLTLDPVSGIITGSMQGAIGTTQHTITANNPFGQTQASVDVVVQPTTLPNGVLARGQLAGSLGGLNSIGSELELRDLAPLPSRPRAAVLTADGTRIYVATEDNRLLRVPRDPISGAIGDAVSLGIAGNVQRLALSTNDTFLFAFGSGIAQRYAVQPDGSILQSGQAAAPGSGVSAILVGPNSSYLAVGSTSPGALWIYDISPIFALRGESFFLDPQADVWDLLGTATRLYAATSIYDFGASTYRGHLRSFRIATPSGVAGGESALTQIQDVPLGNHLTSMVWAELGTTGNDFLVGDSGLGRLYAVTLTQGQFVLPVRTIQIGGSPFGCEVVPGLSGPTLCVLDTNEQEIELFDLDDNALPRLATLDAPDAAVELIPARGPAVRRDTAVAAIACDGASRIETFTIDAQQPFAAAVQGPFATTSGARDLVSHPFLAVLYAAQRNDDSILVIDVDEFSGAMARIESEALPAGSMPIALALGPGGRTLYALNEQGEVLRADVDRASGGITPVDSLPIPGSLVGARLGVDPMGEHVYVAQPAAGRVVTLRVSPFGGALSIATTLNAFTQPTDLAPSLDGRFVYIVDRAGGRVHALSVDRVSGGLTATGSSLAAGVASTRIALREHAGERLGFVLDPGQDRAYRFATNALSGALQVSTQPWIALSPGPRAISSFAVGNTLGPLFVHDSAGGASFEAHWLIAPDVFGPWTSAPVGSGPSSIATISRYVVPQSL